MKVLFDVNVIIDVWGKTEDFAYSFEAMDVAIVREFELCITASMTPSIVYLLSARKLMSRKRRTRFSGTWPAWSTFST